MLTFAALAPHPPIIIPEIGKEQTSKVKKTISAMRKLAADLTKTDPETIIVISPHGLIYPDRMNICDMGRLKGDFSRFGAKDIKFEFKNDLKIAKEISEAAKKNDIQTLLYDNGNSFYELDHGILTPLNFLSKNLSSEIKILPINYSYQDKTIHFTFGETLAEVSSQTKRRIAIIASGDLSHRLFQAAPAGYSESGKEFDKLLLNYFKNKDTQGILEMDDDFIEEAGECGYRSILILLGAIEKLDWKAKILSYEGPFGVGYAIVNFNF